VSTEEQNQRLWDLLPMAGRIEDVALRESVIAIWRASLDQSAWEDAEACPSNPALVGYPIIRQSNTIAEMSLALLPAMAAAYPDLEVDRDRLLASALLLDVSKLVEMEPDGQGGVRFSELTRTMPHAVYAGYLCLQHGLDRSIVNAVLAHTKHTNAKPRTLEAVILHYVDYMLADCMRFHRDAPLLMEGLPQFGKT